MTNNQENQHRLGELICLMLDGELKEDQFAELENMLANNPAAQEYYDEFIDISVWMYHHGNPSQRYSPQLIGSGAEKDGHKDVSHEIVNKDGLSKYQALDEGSESKAENIMRKTLEQSENIAAQYAAEEAERQAKARHEDVQKAAEVMFKEFQDKENRRMKELAYRRRIFRQNILFTSIGVLAASLILVLSARFLTPKPQPQGPIVPSVVAKIVQSLDAQWGDSDISTMPGTQLTVSTLQLKRGLVRIAFESGAEVILQAPCKIKPENVNQFFLLRGNITAIVPDKAIGFTVRTPTATLVDYGTEFGVMANTSGETEVHVFKGEVDLRSGPDACMFGKSRRIKTCQAGMVDSQGGLSTRKIKYQAKRFIRKMPAKSQFGRPGERLDLTDIVGGGTGFGTGDSNQSINPDNGQRRSDFRPHDYRAVRGGHNYVPIADLDFIDGVFIPDDGDGPIVVSSEGHTFHERPNTNGRFGWNIFNGNFSIEGNYLQTLNGQKYGTLESPGISIHSNAGITFDLDKIRDSLPGSRIVSFSTLCGGLAKNIRKAHGSTADFRVLVDGQKRFEITGVHWQGSAKPIHITLTEQDRFLTLMVTDGGEVADENKANFGDLGLFAEPALTLAPM